MVLGFPHLLLFVEDKDNKGFSFAVTLLGFQYGVLYTCEGEIDARTLDMSKRLNVDLLSLVRAEMALKIYSAMLEDERKPTI